MKFIVLLYYLCAHLTFAQAKLVEFAHFEDLSSYVTPNALLILDIDDTLLIPVQMLGCDEWFKCRQKVHEREGMGQNEALEKSLAEWEAIRHLTKMEIVEDGTEKVIHSLQKKGVHLMGLTTQGLALATRTTQQLLEKEIDLALTAPGKKDHYFRIAEQGVLYKNGVLFTSGTHKGEALFHFCDAMNYHPEKIVFINDKASHLAEIEASAEKRAIPFIGLRYNYSDARKKAFRPEVADYQFSYSSLARLLSDEEAIEKMP